MHDKSPKRMAVDEDVTQVTVLPYSRLTYTQQPPVSIINAVKRAKTAEKSQGVGLAGLLALDLP